MASASWALQKALHAALTTSADVLAALGGPNIWDHVPRGATTPYVTFGVATTRDWSTDSEPGAEHIVTLRIWSKAAGRHEADTIADALRAALHDQVLTLDSHHLVNLRHEITDIRREADDEMYLGVLRFRAVTEPTS